MILGLQPLDLVVVVGYFVLIIWVGLRVARGVKDTSHYFIGSWAFGKLVMIGQSFGAGTSSEQPVGVSGAVYKSGLAGVWVTWKYLFVTPFYWLLGPIFRRTRYMTTADFYEQRYGSGMAVAYTAYAVLFQTFAIGSTLLAAAKMIEGVTGGHIPKDYAILVMLGAYLLYSFLGGLASIAITDLIQGFFVIVMSFILIPLGIHAMGGLHVLGEKVPASMFDIWHSANPKLATLINPFMIAALSINSLIGIVVQPHMMSTVGSGKTDMNARVGMTYGNIVKRACTVGWAFVGLVAIVLLPNLEDPETGFGRLCHMLLPAGGLGLIIACVMAANLDSCATFMVNSSTLLTQNIYRRFIRPSETDRHYLYLARGLGLAISAIGVGFSFAFESVVEAILAFESMVAYMGISFFGAVMWRRANRYGAWASLIVSLVINYGWGLKQYLDAPESQREIGLILKFYPAASLIAIAAGFLALAGVSLLTRPEPQDKIDDFYKRLHTPAVEGDAAKASEVSHG